MMAKIVESTLGEAGKKGVSKAIDLLVDKFINPKLESILNAPHDIFVIHDLIREYLNKKYENDKYMNTIVFQRETKTIDDLYIPLTIVQNGKKNNKLVLNEDMKNIFSEPTKMLIIDTAGTGKSTLLRFLSIMCIEKQWGIPFIIELRKIEKKQTMEAFIIEEIKLSNANLKDVDIIDLIRRGDFIFFLDGFDEILEDNKVSLTKEIRRFFKYAERNNFVLASREDDCLSEFGDFVKYHIQELTKAEAYKLIEKYDKKGAISKDLINEIERNENYNALKEFLGNPLMVSLLYLTYQYKGVLQYKKHIFYRQVYDALYDRHDTTKGVGVVHVKKSKLDIEDFRRVLCAMGFISLKEGRIEFDKDQMINIIDQSIELFEEINANSVDYLDDILHAVPLFVEEGLNYKWAHKSFAEYFAAVYICQECKEYENKILKDILENENNQKFYNMLDFCYDIDYKAVIDNLVYPVLTQFISLYDLINKEMDSIDLREEEIFYRFIDTVLFVKFDNTSRPKKRDVMSDYIEVIKLLKTYGVESFSYMAYLSRSENIIMVVQRKPIYEIIKLLYRKSMNIFKEVKVREYPMKFLKEIKEVGVYDIFQSDKYPAMLEHRNEFVSCIYHHNSDFNGNILDINKCKEKIKEIEIKKSRRSNDFFSLN